MTAWPVRNRWSPGLEVELAREVARLTKRATIGGRRRFVCEDLILAPLIAFASRRELPLRITNGEGVFDPRDHRFSTVDQFYDVVFKTTGADDLLLPENTIARGEAPALQMEPKRLWSSSPDPQTHRALDEFGTSSCVPLLRRAAAGDMLLLMDTGSATDVSHCQLVLRNAGSELRILQGNFRTRVARRRQRRPGQSTQRYVYPCDPFEEQLSTLFGRGPGDPRSACYLGEELEEGTYRFDDLTYRRASSGSGQHHLSKVLSAGVRLRRWNVQAFA